MAAPLNCEDYVVTAAVERAYGDRPLAVADENDVQGIEILLRNGGGKGLHIKSIVASSDALPLDTVIGGDANYKCAWVKPVAGVFLFKAGSQTKFSLTNLTGPADMNDDGDKTDASAADLGVDIAATYDSTGDNMLDITVDENDPNQENGCPYNNVGSPKNRYDIVIKYSLANSPSIVHTLNGEMFASAPAS